MTTRSELKIRSATLEDAPRIAALHAASWREHYRGELSDYYLDGPIEAERKAVWTERLRAPRPGQIILLAEMNAELVGFVCFFLDHDRVFGTFVDNLHVAFARKGSGIGRALMLEVGEAANHAIPRRPISLTVLKGNVAAQRFYERIGGRVVEEGREVEPDGSEVAVYRYLWDSPAALMAGTAG